MSRQKTSLMHGLYRKGRRDPRRGAITVLAALVMTIMLGMVAFAIDCGVITLAKNQLQNAADAGALAGVQVLSSGTAATITAAQTAAQANSVGHAAVSVQPANDIQFGTWNASTSTFTVLTGSAESGANAVKVTCVVSQSRSNALTLFFAPIFGMSSANVTASAVAAAPSTIDCGPFVGLNGVTMSGGCYTDSYNSSSGPYSAGSAGNMGNICSNSNITLSGGATINGNAHPGTGDTVSISGGASVTGSTSPLSSALSEAAVNSANAATSNNNGSIPKTSKGNSPLDGSNNFSMSGGDSVTLPAGTYYFASLTLSGGATLTVSGATIIYVTGNINLSGGSSINGTNVPADLQVYCQGSSITTSGGNDFYGVIYAPTATITRSGGSNFFGMLVGKSLTLSGGSGLHYDTALNSLIGGGGSSKVQLVQ